jgi:RNA polymerase sigma-70 factor (ECF subfamily)
MRAKVIPLRRIEGEIAELSDEALVAACGTGDPAALGALFDRFHRDVYRFVGRFPSIDEHARDDLVQATFLDVRRIARSFRGASSVRTWILGVAANLARRAFRGERRRWLRQARYLEHPAPPLRAVDEHAAQRLLLGRVAATMAALPPELQLVFVLCDLEQLPSAEVARIVGVPVGTVWRRLHDARKAIRTAIERSER